MGRRRPGVAPAKGRASQRPTTRRCIGRMSAIETGADGRGAPGDAGVAAGAGPGMVLV